MRILNLRIIEASRVEIIIKNFFYNFLLSHHVLASWSSKWQQIQSLPMPRKVPLPAVSPASSLPLSAAAQPQEVLQSPAWPWLSSATLAVSEPPHNVCWDTGCSLLYTSNCLNMTVNIQIKQHLSQEASWAGCGWMPVFSFWKIKVTGCHTIFLCLMLPLGKNPMVYGH